VRQWPVFGDVLSGADRVLLPGPGSSEVILEIAAYVSVKMVTVPSAWSLDAASRKALSIAAYSAS